MEELPVAVRRALRREVRKQAWQAAQEWTTTLGGLAVAAAWAGWTTWTGVRLGEPHGPEVDPGDAVVAVTVLAVVGVVAIPIAVWTCFFISAWKRKAYELKVELLEIEAANEPVARGCRTIRSLKVRVEGTPVGALAVLISESTMLATGHNVGWIRHCFAERAGATDDQVDAKDVELCVEALRGDGLLDSEYSPHRYGATHNFRWTQVGLAVVRKLREETGAVTQGTPQA